jgi:hypothetical protein
MAVAIWISVIYLNRRSRGVTAVIGGVGFGFFIDELGKFITSDNDYFFKPAAGIIYLIFILMFLLIRELSRRQRLDQRTALANALAFLPSTVIGDFQQADRKVVGELLDRADPEDPLVAQSRTWFEQASTAPVRPPSRLSVLLARMHERITEISRRPWFRKTVIWVIVIWAFLSLAGTVTIEVNVGDVHDGTKSGEDSSLSSVLRGLSILTSTVLVGVGVVRMWRGQHQRAYRAFALALLVSIFITRFFSFLDVQFAAVFGLFVDLLLLAAVAELSENDSQKKDRFGGLGNGLHGKEEATG